MEKFLGPNFLGGTTQSFVRQTVSTKLSTIWQSLVKFRLLISVCEAWQ